MSDSLERANDVEAPLTQLKQQLNAEQPARRASVSGRLSLLLLLAFAAAAATGGYYWGWPQWQQVQQQMQALQQQQQGLTEQNRQLLEANRQLQQDVKLNLQQQLSQMQQSVNTQQQQQAEQLNVQLQAMRQLVQQRDSAPPRHWLLAEVEHLLKLAAQKVWLQQDTATAVSLLQSADEKLATLDDASLLAVRQAIAADTRALQAVVKVDVSKLHVQLQQLRQQTMLLPLKQQAQPLKQQAPEASLDNWRATLAYHWQQTWQGLLNPRAAVPEDYFDLSTEQQLMLRIALQQQLQLAQLAVMQQQPQVYVAALQHCSDQLQRYFNANSDAVQQFSQGLTQLAAVDITPPALSALLSPAQLQQYLQQLAGDNL